MYILSNCGWLPDNTVGLIHSAYNVVQILVPVLIVVMGAIDFVKSVMAGNDAGISNPTKAFIQKLVAGGLAFMSFAFVNWVAGVVGAQSDSLQCVSDILNGSYRAEGGISSSTTSSSSSNTTTKTTTSAGTSSTKATTTGAATTSGSYYMVPTVNVGGHDVVIASAATAGGSIGMMAAQNPVVQAAVTGALGSLAPTATSTSTSDTPQGGGGGIGGSQGGGGKDAGGHR